MCVILDGKGCFVLVVVLWPKLPSGVPSAVSCCKLVFKILPRWEWEGGDAEIENLCLYHEMGWGYRVKQ